MQTPCRHMKVHSIYYWNSSINKCIVWKYRTIIVSEKTGLVQIKLILCVLGLILIVEYCNSPLYTSFVLRVKPCFICISINLESSAKVQECTCNFATALQFTSFKPNSVHLVGLFITNFLPFGGQNCIVHKNWVRNYMLLNRWVKTWWFLLSVIIHNHTIVWITVKGG